MKTPDPSGWHRTSPFAILFFIGRISRNIAKNAWQSLAPFIAFLFAYQGELVNKLLIGGAGFVIILTTASILSYWFFRYRILTDSVLIRQGVINKKQLDIKFERIQGINIEQNVIYRYLGLVTLNFDTAGSIGNEGNLPAVTQTFADSLRLQINGNSGTGDTSRTSSVTTSNALLRLTWHDMIRIGLTDRRALILFAFAGPFFERISDDVEQIIIEWVEIAAGFGLHLDASNAVSIAVLIVMVIVIILVVISIAAAFLRFYNFELTLDHNTLRSVGGLFTRHEHSMNLGKIQTLRLQQGIVQALLGRHRMTAHQAMSGGRQRTKKVFDIPVVTAELADQLRKRLLAPESGNLSQDPKSAPFVSVSPYYMRSGILFLGLLPALIATIALAPQLGIYSLLILLWVPAVALLTFRKWRRAGYLHDDNEIIRRSGLFGYRTVGLLFRKAQRVTITQSRYQRRKSLASLRIHMASGSVRIPYIDHTVATQLRNYMLYKIEVSQQAWH